MCIDKTDIFGSYSGFFHSLTDGESQAVTGSGRTGDVIGIVADSPPPKAVYPLHCLPYSVIRLRRLRPDSGHPAVYHTGDTAAR